MCGWHNTDLRLLPVDAVADLAGLLGSLEHCSFPRRLLQACVAVMGKVPCPTQPQHGRPITILSNLYRVWAAVFCQQTLMVWSRTLPASIQGCLKRRSSTHLEAEAALASKVPCTGVAIDLKRAFNTLPRAPLLEAMTHLGVPRPYSAQ